MTGRDVVARRNSAEVREHEITGYGSNCTWSRSMRD
jgi:hypothetical protein